MPAEKKRKEPGCLACRADLTVTRIAPWGAELVCAGGCAPARVPLEEYDQIRRRPGVRAGRPPGGTP